MEKKNHFFGKILALIIVFFLGCIAMFFMVYKFPDFFKIRTTHFKKDVTITDEGIADAVEKVYDAVVIVSSYNNNTLFATGTGFVYNVDGKTAYVLTNNHVIEDASKVTLRFTNNEVIEAKIVGTNALTDIAVLSIDSKDIINVAQIGKSEDLKIGDTSFAVGAPLDSVYSWTVTRGIISGKDRMIEVKLNNNGEYVMKVLQTDAAINSGNSGGPLCNSNGEVIGITSLKLIDESVEGMGFAIPIEIAEEYAEKIIKGETITQPYLGVSMINVTDAYYRPGYSNMLTRNNITSGVVVASVESDSPAYKAGLENGDIIIKLNNYDISSIAFLRYYLYNYEPGDKIEITYIRDGNEKTTTVTLTGSARVY